MALTQSMVQMPDRSWDEEVVPALRKRLESESRTLARRMSAVSVSSVEEPLPSISPPRYDRPSTAGLSTNDYPTTSFSRSGSASSNTQRSRTLSQPQKPQVSPHTNGYATKPTRIPRSKRSPSITSSRSQQHQQAPAYRPSTDTTYSATTSNLRVLHEVDSKSSLSAISRKGSAILNEPAPFQPGSVAFSLSKKAHIQQEEAPPRTSTDSEERPYQHWYRGDVSRNGGVGELRVAKRQEMMEIANYGHRPPAEAPNAITRAINERRRQQRRRADSLDSRHRASLYMDEDALEQVMDEDPLTDLDYDPSDRGQDHTDYYQDFYDDDDDEEQADFSTASAPMATNYDSRTGTPTQFQTPPSSRIAAPSTYTRGQSEPPSFPSSSHPKLSTPTSNKTSRGRSPAPPSASAKAREEQARATRAKAESARRHGLGEKRRSIAQYPDVEGELENAIPTWTQAVPKSGNWDEVVLPVVARKKGLDGHYEQGDGSPKPRSPQESPIEPAPGTFGFDYSKYRPPRDGDEFIPMDEFGRPAAEGEDAENEKSDVYHSQAQYASSPHDETPVGGRKPQTNVQPPKSPAPFSQYHTPNMPPAPVPSMEQGRVQGKSGKLAKKPPQDSEEEEEKGGGCCKCVVM